MSAPQPSSSTSTSSTTKRAPQKAPRLPPTHRISKRAPLRPSIPSPYTSARSPKIIYLRPSTPFVSALKRAQKLLAQVAKREEGRDKWPHRRREDHRAIEDSGVKGGLAKRARAGKGAGRASSEDGIRGGDDDDGERDGDGGDVVGGMNLAGGKSEGKEEVILKGMGRAIQKALELGLWFQGKQEYRVRIKTSETGVVDDIVENETEELSRREADGGEKMDLDDAEATKGSEKTEPVGSKGTSQSKNKKGLNVYSTDDIPEARIRKVSVIEVGISWR